jgi:hypothetical protein
MIAANAKLPADKRICLYLACLEHTVTQQQEGRYDGWGRRNYYKRHDYDDDVDKV